jgi:hypothetical protein
VAGRTRSAYDVAVKLKIPLVVSAVYMALVAVGHLVAPVAMSAGVVPADASPGMVAFLRHYGALFTGLAVLNFLVRNEGPSAARRSIALANVVVFGLGATLDVVAVLRGAGPTGLVPASINLAIAVAFVIGNARQEPATGV